MAIQYRLFNGHQYNDIIGESWRRNGIWLMAVGVIKWRENGGISSGVNNQSMKARRDR
jgi:hypothetical protein